MHDILMKGKEKAQHPHAFDGALHIKEHALDVGVMDNGHGAALGIRNEGALDAVTRVGHGMHVGSAGAALRLYAGMDAGCIHEVKHDLHP